MRALIPITIGLILASIGCSPPTTDATKKAEDKAKETPAKVMDRTTVFQAHNKGVVYVANSGDDTLSVYDRDTLELLAGDPVRAGHQPGSVFVAPSDGPGLGRVFFPARFMSQDELSSTTPKDGIEDGFRRMSLWAIDPAQGNGIVQKAYIGDPDKELDPVFLILTPDARWAAVSDWGTNRVYFRDQGAEERKLNSEIETGPGPLGSAFSPDGQFFVVANNDPEGTVDPDTVSLINFLGNDAGPVELGRIAVGDKPSQVAAAPDNVTFYVTVTGSKKVVAINATTKAIAGEWALEGQPTGITRNAAGSQYFIALADRGEVIQVNPADGSVSRRVTVGKEPYMLALDESGHRLWVTNRGEDTVSVIKLDDFTLERNLKTGKSPTGVAIAVNPSSFFKPDPALENAPAIEVQPTDANQPSALVPGPNTTPANPDTVAPD